jgi:hypothetical protein
MPVGRDRAGMPVGLQLTAPACAEERLLAIARAAERLLGTAAVGIASQSLQELDECVVLPGHHVGFRCQGGGCPGGFHH